MPLPTFLLILSPGRSGSTLLMRVLNAVPNVRISGENDKAFDHLAKFVAALEGAKKHQHSAFYREAWKSPCDRECLIESAREFALRVYNPEVGDKLVGFKETRYGEDYDQLTKDIAFFREMFLDCRVVFNPRDPDTCLASYRSMKWETLPPLERREKIVKVQENFRRYFEANGDCSYWMPYEELREGSQVLTGMFDFLGLPYTEAAAEQLRIKMRD